MAGEVYMSDLVPINYTAMSTAMNALTVASTAKLIAVVMGGTVCFIAKQPTS